MGRRKMLKKKKTRRNPFGKSGSRDQKRSEEAKKSKAKNSRA
jgi:hypothetical protein